ncbi:MAG: fructose-6-phosphate aldolase [Verrucomicrobiae bacterium]|nr:fructose-6-phosphate aldolase [Verrucomicrobiae bacterium]MCX7721509.1 fructose-6-phosphate aldolase [Verrucomicrobiae bacterium]MDW7981161.1 transaldolase family protein [Verrucomicrobiales bacterium]
MQLFIESAEIGKIKDALSWGIVDGVLLSPALVAATGRRPAELYREIASAVDCPVCVETPAVTFQDITTEARSLARLGRNLLLMVPITKEGLRAVRVLEAENIRTIVAVTFSPLQALLAAKVGASYVSLHIDLLEEAGQSAAEAINQIKTIYRNHSFSTKIMAVGVRQPLAVLEAAVVGADCCATGYDVLGQLYQHLLTLPAPGRAPKKIVTPGQASESVREQSA